MCYDYHENGEDRDKFMTKMNCLQFFAYNKCFDICDDYPVYNDDIIMMMKMIIIMVTMMTIIL